jgi:hypothetical protein
MSIVIERRNEKTGNWEWVASESWKYHHEKRWLWGFIPYWVTIEDLSTAKVCEEMVEKAKKMGGDVRVIADRYIRGEYFYKIVWHGRWLCGTNSL